MKKTVIGILLLTLILSSALSMVHAIKPSFAEAGDNGVLNTDPIQKTNEATLPNNITEPFSAQQKISKSASDTSGYDEDRWNFNDTSQWGNFTIIEGNKTRLIVGLDGKGSASLAQLERISAEHGAKIVNTVSIGGRVSAVVVELLLVSVTAFVEEIHVDGLTSFVEPNMKVQAQFVPNDPYWSYQWGPQKIEADWAWNTTVGGSSLLVAVVDTGIDYTHPDLAADYAPLGHDWVNYDEDPLDDFGHGTHCAGIIAGELNNGLGIAGLAQVRVMAEKVLDQGGYGYFDWVASGIAHATDMGARIISLSLGAYVDSELIHDAIKYACEHGVLVIAPAGNDNTNVKFYPAAYDEVIAVSATDQDDNKAGFSNWGDWIELSAPGVYVYSTMPTYHVTLNDYGYAMNYDYMSGTSMACPHVSGVAALVWSSYPDKTSDWVRLWLRNTADDLGDPGLDAYFGYGRINARKAVEQVPPAHELIAFALTTPSYVEPGTSGIISASVLNFGENNETGVTVQLLANGAVVNTALMDFFTSNSARVSFTWTPAVKGLYNVTFYVVPVLGESDLENNALSENVYVGFPVKAVVLRSAGNVYGEIIANWQVLASQWYMFGDTMINIDYTSLNKQNITYEDIAATEAHVLIISCAYDPYAGWQFTDSEIEAIKRYVYEGHGLLATAGTFYNAVPNNNKLAPLFGMNKTVMWGSTGTDLLHLLNATHPLFVNVPNPLVFPSVGTALPSDGRWDSNELTSGKYLGLGQNKESAIVTFRGLVYISPWLEVIPPYYHHHLQLLYNAIVWSRYQKPQHELVVSLDVPGRLNPGESTLLNATVTNEGLSDETNVRLELFVDSALVGNVTIPQLLVDSSYTLSYPWAPTVQGAYNVTACAPAVAGEEFTENNIVGRTALVLLLAVRNALVYSDDYVVTPSSRYVIVALDDLGINYTYYADDSWGFSAALLSQSWDVVVVDHCNYYSMGNYWTELDDYVRSGGRLVLSTFDIDGSDSEPTTLWDALGVRWVSDMWQPEPVYRWIPSHAVFTFPNTVGDLTSYLEDYADDGDHVAATTGTAIGGFTNSPVADSAGIVVGNAYQTVLFSFILDEFRSDQDRDGNLDAVELWENAIVYLAKSYQHDLAVTLVAPTSLELGHSSLLNATVLNNGLNDETDVDLYLLINNSVVSSATNLTLLTSESYSISFPWTPTNTGTYNLTAYAPPAAGEEKPMNNVVAKRVGVFFYERLYFPQDWIDGGVAMGWHADDSCWQYTLPFDFPFYGIYYRTIHVSSNGLLTFNGPDANCGNSVPALAGKMAIAPAWDDWVTYDPYDADIFVWQNSTHIGIRWYVAACYDRSVVANFEVILSSEGVIQFDYEFNNGPVSATAGISNGAGHILAEDFTNLNNIGTTVFWPHTGKHDVAVASVVTSANEVKAGDDVNITVIVENQGNFTEDFDVKVYAIPQQNSESTSYATSLTSPTMYLDPSDYLFKAETVSIGYRFNVTVKVANAEDPCVTWEVGMYCDGSMIKPTRWFEPTWDPEYVFYGKTTIPGGAIGEDYAVVGAVLFPGPPEQEPFNGSGKLCTIEFEMTAVPQRGKTLSCSLIIDNTDSFLLDPSVREIPTIKENGYYELSSLPVDENALGTLVVTGLAPGERETLSFIWNTTNAAPGDYLIFVDASDVPYDIDIGDNAYSDGVVMVKPAVVMARDVAVTDVIIPSNVVYQGWTLGINVTVENLGNLAENFAVALYYDNNVIDTQPVQNLTPNATLTLLFSWNTTYVPYCRNYNITAIASTVPSETNTNNNRLDGGQIKVRIMGDINDDEVANMVDVAAAVAAFNSHLGGSRWNAYADLNQDGIVNMKDIVAIVMNFNKHG